MPFSLETIMRRAVVVCLALLGAAPLAAQTSAPPGPLKIAFINSREILAKTPGYAAAESTFNREVAGYRDELQRLQQQLDSATQAYDQQSIALSPAAKQAKVRELQQMQQRLQQRNDDLQQRAQQREQELLAPIQSRVQSIIQGLRAEGNYSFIFDADAPGSSLVAADPALNITARVLQRLPQAQ